MKYKWKYNWLSSFFNWLITGLISLTDILPYFGIFCLSWGIAIAPFDAAGIIASDLILEVVPNLTFIGNYVLIADWNFYLFVFFYLFKTVYILTLYINFIFFQHLKKLKTIIISMWYVLQYRCHPELWSH